jgi:phospholipid/cholesterol/gamma-HCH transport system substrate-binding protein
MTLSVPRALAWIGMVLAGIALVLILFTGGDAHPYTVYAVFRNADDLLPNNFVKIDGIEAGVVKAVSLNKAESEVIVKLGLDPDAAPIGMGASAAIRPVNLLGEKYLDLAPGNTTRPLPSGSTIPISRTSEPVELDDVFNALDPSTRAGLAIVINQAGLAMAGRSADFMQTLRDLPPTLSSARQVVGEVANENAALRTAIVSGNQTLATIDSRRGDLQALVGSGNGALQAIDAARASLGQTIADAPGGLAQLRTTLRQLQSASDALTPAARELEATTPALGQTLARLPQFASEADSALAEARSVAPALARLGTQSTPVLKLIRPTSGTLAAFAKDARPLLATSDQGGGLNQFLAFVNGWANVTKSSDMLGHVFRLRFSLDNQFLTSALSEYKALYGLRRHAPRFGAPRSGLAPSGRGAPAPAPTGKPASPVAAGVGGLVSGVGQGVKNLLGSTGATVNHVLGQLTGGATRAGGTRTGPGDSASTPTGAAQRLLQFLLGS